MEHRDSNGGGFYSDMAYKAMDDETNREVEFG